MTAKTNSNHRPIMLAITGASGSLYSQTLLEFLLAYSTARLYIVVSEVGKQVIRYELKSSPQPGSLPRIINGKLVAAEKSRIRVFQDHDFFAPMASGTAAPASMVVLPCSMGTAARIAAGMSSSLIERSADVMIKQKKQLIVCPRESPLSELHLTNLLRLARLNAHIIPLMPAMYQHPKTILDLVNFSIGRVCEALDYAHEFYTPWNKRRL